MKNKITKCLVLGGEGMLGHMVVKYIKTLPDFEVQYTTRNEKNKEAVILDVKDILWAEKVIKKINPDLVINCVGIINSLVKDNKEDVAFINSYLPHKLAQVCKDNGSKLIHISTDCVFNGLEGNYAEDSNLSPTDFYGLSKATGEVDDDYNLTIRTSIIGPELKGSKKGLMEWFFTEEGEVPGYVLAIWSGVTTLELAKQIINLYKQNVTGLINIVSKPISKYDLLKLIDKVYDIRAVINL